LNLFKNINFASPKLLLVFGEGTIAEMIFAIHPYFLVCEFMIYLTIMRHDLIVTFLQNDHAKKIIARLICQKQSIPLQRALQLVKKTPFVFLINASAEEIHTSISQLKPLGVNFKTIDSMQSTPEHSIPIPDQPLQIRNAVPYTQANVVKEKVRPVLSHLSSLDAPVPKKSIKRKFISVVVSFLVISLPIVLISISFNKRSSLFLSEYTGTMQSTSIERNDSSKKKPSNSKKKNTHDLPIDKAKSDNYTDSASAQADNYNQAVNFYLIAISFNKHNYKAWYGLINTYYNMDRPEEALNAEAEMKRIFGNAIFDVNKIIKPFGTIITAQLDQDSIYSIEYKSIASNKKALINESYQIIRALKPTCNCASIALFASHTAGTGVIVHINKTKNFISQYEFENVASITYLE
jgi:hypothetical protein